jgi:branched-chain amino acid transport system permease protein
VKGRAARAVALAALAAAPLLLGDYQVALACDIGMNALVALGLVLLTGVARLTSFGQAAFVGLGAYATAVWTTAGGARGGAAAWLHSPWVGLAAALALALAAALLLGAVTLRLSGHYLPLGTIAWGTSLYFLFGNLEALGGHTGLGGIPPLTVFGRPLDSARALYPVVAALLAAAVLTTRNLLDSREGRALRALAAGRVMAEAMGVDTARSRAVAFGIAALQAGAAGWLYAHFQRFVNPTPFSLHAGIEYLFMAVVGGIATPWGALLGAAIVTVVRSSLQDALPRLLGRPGDLEAIAFAAVMIVLLQRAPDGLWPALARRAGAAGRRRAVDRGGEPLPRRALAERGAPLLELVAVTKRFGGLVAVDAVSLSVRAGEIVALIGPNGAGKSTLFDVVSGVAAADAGQVRLGGERVDGRPPRDLAARGLARTFQHVRLVPEMTAVENAALGAHLRGRAGLAAAAWRLDRAEDGRLLAEAARQLDRVGLSAHLLDLAGGLPLGKQRLVEVARALAADPRILLLDEPAAGLRSGEKRALAALLAALRGEGLAILLVEHDAELVMGLADRVVVMDFGEVIAAGPPADVRRDARVVEAYLGSVA